MQQKNQHTALLVFAEKATTASRKQLLGNVKENRVLHQNLLAHTLQSTKHADLPMIRIHEDLQRGQTFGTRLINAMKDVFEMGYEQIIVVGSDTPQLSSNHIRSAEQRLKDSPLVLGPSTDGGIYLLALRKSHFEFFSTLNIRWQCGKDFSDIVTHWMQLGFTLSTLETLRDIDSSNDLFELQQLLGHAVLYAPIFKVGTSSQFEPPAYICRITSEYFQVQNQRAPPIA